MTPITLTPAHTRIAEALFWLGLASCYFLLPEHLSLMSQILIFGLFAVSLDMALGYAGILTVGHATRSAYEVAHHQSHGLKAGLSEEQLAAVADFESSDLFDETEKAVMRLAAESTLRVDVSEETWRAAAAHLTDRQMVELSLSVAWYNSGVRVMGLLGIDLEDNYPNPFPNS